MADVNANIGVNIDTSNALAQLKALQRQISQFHTSISKSSEAAALAQRDLQRNFINSVNSIGAFSAELRTVKTTAESFTDSLEKNKFSMREYFRFAGGATKTFGRLFKSEFDTVNKVAEENVKRLQTQYIKMGRDASGAMRAIAIMPNQLDMSNASTQLQMAAQRQAIFNQLLKQGSTNLLNFGKNTQWAGRQLMVGFTLPLASLGAVASRTFMDMETAAIKFRKVYGDLFTPEEERQQALADITALGEMFTRYGIAVSSTVNLAADAAAAGFQGLDLQRQVTEATRLQVLGQIDQQKALETTISLQNAFKLSNDDLSNSINFLNAVENQTVVSLDDITTAIPKVAPVIMQLGGNVKDLAFFLTAMKQGGVNASEGANALKSGLASLINPTEKASAMLSNMGINIAKIVETNQGNLRATVIEFAKALDTLDPLTRARAIEQLFGKFQFARLSTLFENVTAGGTQASRVLDLAGYSAEELAATAESELGITADSAMNKFRKTVESLRLALVPIGETFLEAMTPIVEFVGGILERFNNLPKGVKKAITLITVALGAIGPIALMTFGLLANGAANLVKGLMILRNGYLRLTGQTQVLGEQTQYLTVEQQNALAVASSLDQSHARLVQTFTSESAAVQRLAEAYDRAIAAGVRFSQTNPGMMRQPFLPGFQDGIISVPGTGTEDKYPAMVAAGEAIIPAKLNQKYAPLVQGIIADNIPGFQRGKTGSASGRFAKAPADIKKELGLFKAPSVVRTQTEAMSWSTLDAELQAIEDSVRSYLESIGDNAESIQKKINALKTKQASHLQEQITQIEVAGEVVNVKLWSAENLQADLGAINNYLNSIHKVTRSMDPSEISRLAQELGMTIDEFEQELRNLEKGMHPATRSAANVLQKVAEKGAGSKDVTTAYQSRAVAGVLQARAGGDFYETLPQRAYSPEKDLAALEILESKLIQFRQKIINSFTIGDDIAAISGQNIESIRNLWDQLSTEAKARLLELRNDAGAFTQALLNEAKEAGIAGFELGDAAITGIAQGTRSMSPSQDARQQGQNVVDGFEQGILEGMDDASMAGQQLRGAANNGLGGNGGGGTTGGATGGAASSGGSASSTNLAKFNSALMGVSFALTSVSGVASAFGGRFQGLSEAVFKISGLMFGLMSVVQLLTQEMFANVIAARANKVATAMGATSFKGLFAGATGFGSKILTAGKFAARFAGGLGLAVGAITATVSIIKKVNVAREKERMAIEGLGNAARLSADKMKSLGDFFGVVPRAGALGRELPEVRVASAERTRIEEFKASDAFKELQPEIDAIKNATAKEAQLALKSLAINLKGSGFAENQVQTIISAIQEVAGKTDVKIDVKSLNVATLEGMAELTNTVSGLVDNVGKQFTTGYSEKVLSAISYTTGEVITWTEKTLSKGLRRSINTAGKSISSIIDGLAGQLESGSINAEQFASAMSGISKQLESMPVAQALLITDKIFESLPKKLAAAAGGLTNISNRMLILEAKSLGVTTGLLGVIEAMKILDGGAAYGPEGAMQIRNAEKTLDDFMKRLDAARKKIAELAKDTAGTGRGAGDGEKSIFQKAIEQLKEQQKELLNTNKAYNKLKKAGVDTARAFEIAKDPILAAAIATTKVGTEKWKKLLGLIKEVNKELLKAELKNFFETRNAEVKFQKAFANIIPQLQGLGLELEDIQDILSNPALAEEFIKDLKDGSLDAERLKKYIDQIPDLKKIEILLDVDTKTVEEQFEDAFNQMMEYFDIQSKMAQAEYKPKIVSAEQEVENAQNTVNAIQSEIDKIQDSIDAAQRVITEKFDRPIESLQEEISDLQRRVEEEIDRPIEDLNKQIEKLQRNIEEQFNRPIESLNKQIEKLQRNIEEQFDRPISALQEESSDLANDLALIDRAAESINEKYDAQQKALQEISDINQEIISQEKSRISIADALSRGDIAAAAQAAQEAKEQEAAAAAQRAGGTLQAAREAELSKLRAPVSGLTREQIDQRQFIIGQQIFALEEQRDIVQGQILLKQDQIYALEQARYPLIEQIRAKEDQIYAIEQSRYPLLEQIRAKQDEIYKIEQDKEIAVRAIREQEDKIYKIQVERLVPAQQELEKKQQALDAVKEELAKRLEAIDLEKSKWELADLALKNAQIEAGKYNGLLNIGLGLVTDIAKGWSAITTAADAAARAIASANAAAANRDRTNIGTPPGTIPKVSGSGSSGSGGGGGGGNTAQIKMYGGKIKRMAVGGFVPGKGMTDKVPALLTPGEYVVNKSSAKSFGPLLSALNESKYPSMLKDSVMGPSFSITNRNSFVSPTVSANSRSTKNTNNVYNYSVGITVGGTNSSPDSIAQAVMNEIKYIDSQRIRSQRAG